MLDKTLPYYNIIMKRVSGSPIPEPNLPQGYNFCLYSEGDEKEWAEIMVSVGEFDSFTEAMDYFAEHYLPYIDELKTFGDYDNDYEKAIIILEGY